MFRLLKRRRAIKTFVYRLSLELNRRFGQKTFYSLDEIDRVFEGGKYDKAFIAYAYAMFCSRASFDSYFSQLNVKCTYDGLRKFVGDRYFDRVIDFDAASIVRFAKSVGDSSYYESGMGHPSAGSDSHH